MLEHGVGLSLNGYRRHRDHILSLVESTRLGVGRHRVDDNGAERHNNPWPGAQGIVGNIEEQRCPERMAFILSSQHTLNEIAATAGLGARIVDAPPRHGQRNDKDTEDKATNLKGRQHR